MSRLTLRLPKTLHQKLANIAEKEGISLNQYIVYALTQQVAFSYTVQTLSETDRQQQQQNFNSLVSQLEEATIKDIEQALSKREVVQPEPELSSDVVNRLKTKIENKQ